MTSVFSKLPYICDEAYLQKYSMAKAVNYFREKQSIIDILQGPKYTYEHCVKSAQIQSFVWSVFSRIWTEYGDLLRKSA